ncbi:MAG: Rrf2 family transcriptional regulator [Cyclobacterium sp.]|nr:Rrf2 family transcriptional regulator [Cyclobacterium sp.]
MKALSQVGKYGLRAILYLAANPSEGQYMSIRQISDELKLSFHFITKIFRELTAKGILISYRGPSGGVALARPADQIMLIDIIQALEGDDYFDKCLIGLPHCGIAKPCPVHEFWKEIKTKLQKNFSETSLALLGEKIRTQEVRLDD